MKRENEQSLLFRGHQIQKAIASYYQVTSQDDSRVYPETLEQLVKDNRFLTVKRHLRKIYKDPMTENKNWGLVLDASGHIKGVFSQSSRKPIKQGNFPAELEGFKGKSRYSQWKFVYNPAKETKK